MLYYHVQSADWDHVIFKKLLVYEIWKRKKKIIVIRALLFTLTSAKIISCLALSEDFKKFANKWRNKSYKFKPLKEKLQFPLKQFQVTMSVVWACIFVTGYSACQQVPTGSSEPALFILLEQKSLFLCGFFCLFFN